MLLDKCTSGMVFNDFDRRGPGKRMGSCMKYRQTECRFTGR